MVSKIELRILNAFKEILNISDVDVDDNFFELGGDSFDAIKLSKKLGDKIELIEIFKNPTIKKLAKFIENSKFDDKFGIVDIKKKN